MTESVADDDKIEVYSDSEDEVSCSKPPPRGIPKSGRVWKSHRTERHSAMRQDKLLHSTWDKKQRQKAEINAVKALKKEMLEDTRAKVAHKRQVREERRKRKEENRKKSEIVQQIKNPAKLKRAKKRQLRMIQKADTGTEGTAGPGFD